MANGCTTLTDVVRSAHLLRIDGYCVTKAMGSSYWIKSRWNVGGYEWGVHIQPSCARTPDYKTWVALKLILLSQGSTTLKVKANLRCRLVDPTGTGNPSDEKNVTSTFSRKEDCSPLIFPMSSEKLEASSCYLKNDSFTVQCTITVLKEDLAEEGILIDEQSPVPSSNLHLHLGGLLQSKTGADVTFLVSGESFDAHKNILAARSPVLMAEFFGHMREASSPLVVIQDMEAAVFKAMLHFIYTDTVPELDRQAEEEAVATMAQHLLAAADRYSIDRLKLICESKLLSCITADTATSTLALAQQHNCTKLAVKCMEFMLRTFQR